MDRYDPRSKQRNPMDWLLSLMTNQHGEGNIQQGAEDQAWAAANPFGYGQVDAPSPFGYNRDVFNAEHPNYAGGYYNPQTGFYNAQDEVPFQVSGPNGPETIGMGGGQAYSNPFEQSGQDASGSNESYNSILDAIAQVVAQNSDMPGAQDNQGQVDWTQGYYGVS